MDRGVLRTPFLYNPLKVIFLGKVSYRRLKLFIVRFLAKKNAKKCIENLVAWQKRN